MGLMAIVNNGVVEGVLVVDPGDANTIASYGGVLLPDGSPVAVGWLYDGQVFFAPPMYSTLSEAKAAKAREIESARDAACFADISVLGRTWQADKRSQELLGQAITLAQAGLPLPSVWRDATNSDMPVTALSDLLAIAGAIATQTQTAYAHSWALKAQVTAAATVEQINAVAWG
ncbi:MAG: hypothetical protein FD134_1876 [Gallionellaceae bacterium]|nr:MAG: hypothetical protein FD134_1876 [Gallionellaceae bacterium]